MAVIKVNVCMDIEYVIGTRHRVALSDNTLPVSSRPVDHHRWMVSLSLGAVKANGFLWN